MLFNMPSTPAQVSSVHDARAVHDCAEMDWARFVIHGHTVWQVLKLTPARASGSATIPEAYIQAETGHLVTPAGSDTVQMKQGRWEVLYASKPLSPAIGQYSWTEPMLEKRVLSSEDRYSPFIYGGNVLVTHNGGSGGVEQFGEVVLLPEIFEAQVSAGFSLAERNPALVSDGALPLSSVQSTTALLRQKNDLAAARALRLLLQAGQLSSQTLKDALSQAQGYRLSMFIYLLLTTPAPNDMQVDEAVSATLRTHSRDSIRMVAVGILSAADFGPRTASVQVAHWYTPLQAAAKPYRQDANVDAVLTLLGISP